MIRLFGGCCRGWLLKWWLIGGVEMMINVFMMMWRGL